MKDTLNKININLEGATEIVALLVLGIIAVVAMCALLSDGKEIALSIGSGLCGYLTKAAVDKAKDVSDNKPVDKPIAKI